MSNSDSAQRETRDLSRKLKTKADAKMRISIPAFVLGLSLATVPAAAQTHARHTAAHDSAHAIILSDAEHLALHQFLLGSWAGVTGMRRAGHDSLHVRFRDDSSHQQLMVHHGSGVSGFEIRGDTLRWKQDVSGTACTAATPVAALLQAAKAASKTAQISGTMTCGKDRSTFSLRKAGS